MLLVRRSFDDWECLIMLEMFGKSIIIFVGNGNGDFYCWGIWGMIMV